ncbi:MAG: PEP-CTERM sorting domain-containing protein [Methylotenera sp.]
MKKLILSAVLATLPVLSHAAVFTDNFNTDVLALNQTTFLGGWTLVGGAPLGTVDLIGNSGFFDLLPGNGRYVDLDGSSDKAGFFEKNLTLVGGMEHTLSFDLAGSQRGDTNTVEVVFGSTMASYTVSSLDPFSLRTMTFTPASTTTYQILFHNLGGDNFGALLDNVNVTAVPEPSTYMLMLGGLGLVGFVARRRKTADLA